MDILWFKILTLLVIFAAGLLAGIVLIRIRVYPNGDCVAGLTRCDLTRLVA